MAFMFPMLPYSGMRRESVATVKARYLDGQWGLRSVRVKGGKTRDLPLPWWPQRDSNPCFSLDHVFASRFTCLSLTWSAETRWD